MFVEKLQLPAPPAGFDTNNGWRWLYRWIG